MEYSEIQYVGKRVSRLFFGTCIRRMKAGENADDLLDAAFAAGINAFDTARGYGGAERSLGGWIDRRGNRADVVIQTKGGLNGFLWRSRVKERCVRADLERSLKELRTDYVDIYLLHRDDRRVPVGVIVEMLNELVCEGRVRAFGGSNWTYGRIEEANEYAYAKGLQPFTVSSPNFGLAVMEKDPWGGGLTTVTGEKNAAEREWYRRTGMLLVAWSSLGGGLFSGRFASSDIRGARRNMAALYRKAFLYPDNLRRLARAERLAEKYGKAPSQIATAYMLACGMNVFPIVGAGSAEHIRKNAEAAEIKLTEREAAWLDLRSDDGEEL